MADKIKKLRDGTRVQPLPEKPEGEKLEEARKRFGKTLLDRQFLVTALERYHEEQVRPWQEKMDEVVAVLNALNEAVSEMVEEE